MDAEIAYREKATRDGNCAGRLRAILNKSCEQHLTKRKLYGHQPLISKTIQISQTKHANYYLTLMFLSNVNHLLGHGKVFTSIAM